MRDGAKKWTILAATRPLPRAWRVAARVRFLSRLEVAKARRARLLLIAHPKSGNTWLKVMLSRLWQVRFGIPEGLIHKTDEYTRGHPEVPRLAATNGHYSYEGAVGRLITGRPRDPCLQDKVVVLLARHPCDIAVSWYFQFTRRQSTHKQELINQFIEHPVDRRTVGMWDFVRHSDIGLPFLIDYLNGWERELRTLEGALILRYEDLRAEPEVNLQRLTDRLDIGFSDRQITEAVRYGSFDNLRALESSGHFKQGGLTLRNPDDPESFKVRKGKVGGYREYFDVAQVAEMDALVAERLTPALGYGPAADPVRPLGRGGR